MTSTPPPSLPVGLHVAGRRCVVVGGGRVGRRRAVQLHDAGAEVTLVSPELVPPSAEVELDRRGVTWVRRPYRTGDLDGAFLAVAATGHADVDRAILADADHAGVLVNLVSDAAAGDVSFTATRDVGHIQVAVSTDGRTPALTRHLRDHLAAVVADGYPEVVVLFADARDELRALGRPTRHPGWDAALAGGIVDQVRAGDLDGARAALRRHLELAP